MSHYVCIGECQGVSETPLSCQMQSCLKHGLPLLECNCNSGKHEEINKNFLILIVGLPGTGKTTISKNISSSLNLKHIDQNEVRRKQGIKKMPQIQDATLREIDMLVANHLRNGKNVLVDSVHRYMFRRQQLYGVASGHGAQVLVIECVCSPEEAKKRMKNRPNSDGLVSDPNNTKVYDKLSQLWENILEHDFKYPGSDHVSYIIYDSEKRKIEKKIVQKDIKNILDKIESTLESFSNKSQ